MKQYFSGLGEVVTYYFRKKDPGRATNFTIRTMHWINKTSILMLLVGIIYFTIKKLFID
jgi:hypothetical protein